MKLKKPKQENKSNLILEEFFRSDIVKELQRYLNSELKNIYFKGNIGSSFAIYSASVLNESTKNHIFILKDKEEALYFINDLENLIKKEILFLPASYRRSYQFSESNSSNILLRAEVLNKLNNSKKILLLLIQKLYLKK